VVSIVEEFKVFRLGFEMAIVAKPLSPEEFSIIGVVEAFDSAITPRFSDRDEDYLYPQQQTQFDDDAKGTGVPIASPETEFVVDLKKVGDSHSLPTTGQAQSNGLVVFPSLGMEEDPVTVEVHDIQRIEASIPLEVSWSKDVRLMDVVAIQRIGEIGVFHSFGDV
jgi:hypothetical protein